MRGLFIRNHVTVAACNSAQPVVWASASRFSSYVIFLAAGLLLSGIALPAYAQDPTAKAEPRDPVEALITAPQIPLPDMREKIIGNRAQIQQSQDSQLKGCALYKQYAQRRDTEIKTSKERRVQYRTFFKEIRRYMANIYRQYELAQRKLKNFNERKMEPAQIALLQRQVNQLKQKLEEERARLRAAQVQYEGLLEREHYFEHLEGYFPDCYQKYDTSPDPVIYRFMQRLEEKRADGTLKTTPEPVVEEDATPRFSPRKSAQ